jgi:hypothetical protein
VIICLRRNALNSDDLFIWALLARSEIRVKLDPRSGLVTAIKSTIDSASSEYCANEAGMHALVVDVAAAEGGPPRSRQRHLARVKLLPRNNRSPHSDDGAQHGLRRHSLA